MTGFIDAHMHVSPSGKWYESPNKPLLPDAPEDVIVAMDAHDIEIGVIVPGAPDQNEFILQCQNQFPDRLVGCAMIDPRAEDAVAVFRLWVDQGLRGLKFHPIMQQFPDSDFERLSPIVTAAGEMGVHIQIHCSPMFGFSTTEGVLRLALEHPQTQIILLHAGLHRFVDMFPVSRAQVAGVLNNLYIDMSGTIGAFYKTPLWESFRWVMQQIGAEHLVFGTDFPAMDISLTLEAVHDLGFSAEEEQQIMRQNMSRILDI